MKYFQVGRIEENTDIPRKKAKHKKQKLCNEMYKDKSEGNTEKCIPIAKKEKNENKLSKSNEQQRPVDHLNEGLYFLVYLC